MPMQREDPKFAVAAVMSMLQQSGPPNHVHVVRDRLDREHADTSKFDTHRHRVDHRNQCHGVSMTSE
jgi:hypothetical protein